MSLAKSIKFRNERSYQHHAVDQGKKKMYIRCERKRTTPTPAVCSHSTHKPDLELASHAVGAVVGRVDLASSSGTALRAALLLVSN